MTTKIEAIFEPPEHIVSMIEYRGTLFVATERRIYRMRNDQTAPVFEPIMFQHVDSGQT